MAIIGMARLKITEMARNGAAEQWRHPIAQALAIAILALEKEEADCRRLGDEENGVDLRQALATLRLLHKRIAGR